MLRKFPMSQGGAKADHDAHGRIIENKACRRVDRDGPSISGRIDSLPTVQLDRVKLGLSYKGAVLSGHQDNVGNGAHLWNGVAISTDECETKVS